MRRLLVGVVAAFLMLGAAPSATAAEGIQVDLDSCSANGGETAVPAGSRVVIEKTWYDTKRTSVTRFLRGQQTSAILDLTEVANATSFWGPATLLGDWWTTTWRYDTGITLSAGQSLQVTFDIVLTKRLRTGDGTTYEPGSIFGGPIGCRITASA